MGAEVLTVIRGHGTASSRIMDCLGLDEPEKEIVAGIAGPGAAPDLFNALKSRLNFSRPGKGIAFAVPNSAFLDDLTKAMGRKSFDEDLKALPEKGGYLWHQRYLSLKAMMILEI